MRKILAYCEQIRQTHAFFGDNQELWQTTQEDVKNLEDYIRQSGV